MNARDPNGDPEGYCLDANALDAKASTIVLLKDCADYLERHYPGWLWALSPDERGGVFNLFSMRLSGKWGYTFKTETLQHDVRRKALLRGAGELLERFGCRAGPYRHDHWSTLKQLHGLPMADVSDKQGRERREFRTDSIKQGLANGTARIITDADIAKARREMTAGQAA
jgi:hypothetical protein